MAEVILQTQELSRRFGALAAVDGVSLAFQRGRVHAVIGPNGAGKSTFLNLLSGELRASSGSVTFRGQDVTSAPPERISRLGVGRSYQTANVFPDRTCDECVWLASHAHGRDGEAAAALAACGLQHSAGTLAGQLSYGEQRQLEIGMILATGPELLLLDEPLAGLGHDEASTILELLRRLATDHTLILIEHDMEAVFSIADAITVLVNGRVLETGAPAQIRQSAAVREAYLGSEIP
jgi:branched-chain amino acid transport system ATP-binding protein